MKASSTTRKSTSYVSAVTYTTAAARFLQDFAKCTNNVPFLGVIAGVTILILETMEVRRIWND